MTAERSGEIDADAGQQGRSSAALGDVIVLESVRKEYGEFVAVQSADLAIGSGEFFAMLGPSGCGKTTTLKMIAGFEQPTSGRVLLEGVDVSRTPPHKRNVNTVFQQYALFPHMTVAQNVSFGPKATGVDRSTAERRVQGMLEVVRLSDFARRKPAQLSGGQQQRVALARALVNMPSALLLDEPLAALDLKLREAMQLELKRIQREVGITFVFVTHDQGEALTMSDRIAVMSEGVIEQVGSPEEIYHRPATLFVAGFIGSTNLLPGVVRGHDGDDLVVELADGVAVRSRGATTHDTGAKVSVMVRPERLRVLADDDHAASGRALQGTVRQMIFQGATARIDVRLADDTEVVSTVSPDDDLRAVRPGAVVTVGWQPGGSFVLDGWPDRAGATSTDVDRVEASL